MPGNKMRDVIEVAERQLCNGCGACAAAAPERYAMIDVAEHGRRPQQIGGDEAPGRDLALAVCPGRGLSHGVEPAGALASLRPTWGPVLEVFEGWAADPALRREASSGGAASAIALFLVERGGAHGVIHSAARRDDPVQNETVMSQTREDLLSRAGSRYAPASPCDGLGLVEEAPGPCVMIGKPCDIAGARNLADRRPELDRKLALRIGFFCAGAPSIAGNRALLEREGIRADRPLRALRYRGRGWPGSWVAEFDDEEGAPAERELSYEASWGFLQSYRPWRCRLCPDHSGEFADVSVGDPWYRAIEPGEMGSSLIVVRSERGREAVRAAAEAGYLHLERSDPTLLPRSQPNLFATRGRLFGQLWALRAIGAPRPDYRGFPTVHAWWKALSLRDKVKSVVGTWRRVAQRGLFRRTPMRP